MMIKRHRREEIITKLRQVEVVVGQGMERIDADKHLIKMPMLLRIWPIMNAPLADLSGKHWTEPVPPKTHRLMANIDPTLEQQIFDLTQRERIADVHHHCEANDLRWIVEIAEWILHRRRLWNSPSRLKLIFSDNAPTHSVRVEVWIRNCFVSIGYYEVFKDRIFCLFLSNCIAQF